MSVDEGRGRGPRWFARQWREESRLNRRIAELIREATPPRKVEVQDREAA